MVYTFIDNGFDYFSKSYIYIIGISYLLYGVAFLGILYIQPNYVRLFSSFIQLLIALYLIVRFHPFRKHIFRESDSNIIYGSGIFLLINLGLTEFVIRFYDDIKHILVKIYNGRNLSRDS